MIAKVQNPQAVADVEAVGSRKLTASDSTFSQVLTEASSTSGSQVSAGGGSNIQFFGGWTATGAKPAASAPAAPAQVPAAPQSDAAAEPFVPQFMDNVVETSSMGGGPWPLNPAYFATQDTAQYLADKFGTGQIVQVPFGGTGGPYAASAEEYHIVLANGATVNAGMLADYYVRMPESQFPGLADTMIQMAVARAEQFNS